MFKNINIMNRKYVTLIMILVAIISVVSSTIIILADDVLLAIIISLIPMLFLLQLGINYIIKKINKFKNK